MLNYLYAGLRAKTLAVELRKAGLNAPAANIPILYVGGILGTKLYDRQERVNIWGDPGPLLRPNVRHASLALDRNALRTFDEHADKHATASPPSSLFVSASRVRAIEHLHAFPIIPGLVETLVTEELALALEHSLGYSRNRDLIFVGHDWRQDYRLLGQRLEEELARLDTRFGPGCPIVLVGQSVANPGIRWWLRTAPQHVRDRILRWYAFGPPWKGSFHSLHMMHAGYYPGTRRFKGFTPQDIMTYPSAWQLLPSTPQIMDATGAPLEFSFYDPECWRAYRLGPFHTSPAERLPGEDADALAAIAPYLRLAENFARQASAPDPAVDAIPQVWFVGAGNRAVRRAVLLRNKLLFTAKDILREAPHLADQALAVGDEHLPLEHFAEAPCGPFVHDSDHVPYGENYMFVSRPKNHRALINTMANLKVLAFDLAMLRKAS